MATFVPVFLAFHGPAGDRCHIALPLSAPCASTYLPDTCEVNAIDLAVFVNVTHSAVNIRMLWHADHTPS